MVLWKKILIGLILGVIAGVILEEQATIFQPIGTIFINLILMVVIPLIFLVLVNGITNIKSEGNMTRLGAKAVIAFLSTACMAVILGILITTILKPGINTSLHFALTPTKTLPTKNFTDILVNIVPSNALKSMVEGNILHVILFSFFTGFTLNSLRDKCPTIITLCQEGSKVMLKMIETIVQLAPFGVFGYMACVIGTQGIEILLSLSKLLGTIIAGCLCQYIIFGIIISLFAKVNPIPFYKKMIEPQLIAFSTSSSKASLSTLIKVSKEKLGISENNTNFLIPLSSALNMDGGAIYLGSCVVFFAQVTGIDLTLQDYLIIVFTCTLGSIGAAGIPSGILLFLGMALTSVGLPIEAVAIVAGVDRILDMITTTINITGDACITLVIDKTEGTLNEDVYYTGHKKAASLAPDPVTQKTNN